MEVKHIRRYVPVVVGRGLENGNVALCVRYDGSCLTGQNILFLHLLFENINIKIHGIIILPGFLYGCETRSVMLKEERRLRVFENVVMKKMFGPKREEVTGGRRRLHDEELNVCTLD
jgi:hypothetical protein